MSEKGALAKSLFLEGFNCAQAVFAAFAEDFGLSREQALKISSSFGGGFGRMGEVCGAVSGMVMALGLAEGNIDKEEKLAHYEKVRALIDCFSQVHGSYICKELLTSDNKKNCAEYVASAAEILELYFINAKNV